MTASQEIKSIFQYIALFAFGLQTVFPKCFIENKLLKQFKQIILSPPLSNSQCFLRSSAWSGF